MSAKNSKELEDLARFLESDPNNPELIADFAQAAGDAGDVALALEMYERLHALEPLSGDLANLAGIAAMRSGDQTKAQSWFALAKKQNPHDLGLRFNQAWSLALAGDFSGSAELLVEELTHALPQAALLDMQIAHQLGHYDEAQSKMDAYLKIHSDYPALQAASSVLAMDVDQHELAWQTALKAGDHPDALTTLGSLDLAEYNLDRAEAQFGEALTKSHHNPRAQIGLGLVALARKDYPSAAAQLDLGAQQFGDHLGSWLAAGWAYLLADDDKTARKRFETALELDDTFAEAHGSLAVLDVISGEIEVGQRKAEIASRLDRGSFSAILAHMLIANAKDNPGAVEKALKLALSQSVLPGGGTLEQAIIRSIAQAS